VTIQRDWFPLTGSVTPARAATAVAAARKTVIDPLTGPKLALKGRVVTMDDAFTVHSEAIVYVDKGCVVAVKDVAQPKPPDFEDVAVVDTKGTLFPGLIELHNHLSYNALPLWESVPRLYENRAQWPRHKDYRKLISGPMAVIGRYRDAQGRAALIPSLVRYVECKCLLGGVTTSQGVKLYSNTGIQRFYRGIVRNVEQTEEETVLPEATGRIPDVAAKDARSFLKTLKKEDSCLLLHLSEGVTDPAQPDSVARRHFLALQVSPHEWALDEHFSGIHATGLLPEDFDVLAAHKSSMVWSPLSNLLLYGGTARVDAARAAGVPIGLGSDWSPTGSKNLLGELKVAWLYNHHGLNGLLKTRDIVAMATRDAARILKWEKVAGSIAAGMRADFLVIDGASGDPYESLIKAKETDIQLVMINGIARYGVPDLMEALVPEHQVVRVNGRKRRLFLRQATADPDVAQVALSTATRKLRKAFREIRKLAKELEKPKIAKRRALDAPTAPVWSLALDEDDFTGFELRHRLPFGGPRDFTGPGRPSPRAVAAAATKPLSAVLEPITLDPLTVVDDENFLAQIEKQPNVPDPIKKGLSRLY
jgi:5-methylthioadenosine/S-adenosylhomocysteine deaminase